jgi:HD superfamily phosphodiesterase
MPSNLKTMILVKAALSGQYDQQKVSKYDHCVRVSNNALMLVKRYDIADEKLASDIYQVALLHDVLEDSDITAYDLHLYGYSNAIIDAVELLTHYNEDGSYSDYIDTLCASGNITALIGKLADNMDNTSIGRNAGLDDRFKNYLNRRYAGVREKLEAAIEKALNV